MQKTEIIAGRLCRPFFCEKERMKMITKIGEMLERLGRIFQENGKSLQNRGYPKVTAIYEDSVRPNKDTPMFPGEF